MSLKGIVPDPWLPEKLKGLTEQELQKALANILEILATRSEVAREEALAQIREIVRTAHLSHDEVAKAIRTTARRGKAPAIYRNPDNPRQTWSGKGHPPDWFKKYRDPEQLKIP